MKLQLSYEMTGAILMTVVYDNGFCYSHDGCVQQRIYAILMTVMCYSHSTDGATSAKKVQSTNLIN